MRRKALGRRWQHLAKERLEAIEPKLPLGKKFWALAAEERQALQTVFEYPAVADLILALSGRDAERSIRMVDAAYWMKGCSSLGLHRYAVLLGLKNAKNRPSF